MRAYFEANAAHQVPNLAPGIHATATACATAAQNISAATTASNASNTAAGQAQASFEAGLKAARRRLSGLRDELGQLLEDDDDRWYAFGFEKPSDPETPEVPENVTATPGAAGSGDLFVDLDDARRAEKYRVRIAHGTTGAQLAERLVSESEAHFEDLPFGVPLKVTATAVNTAGESAASEAMVVTLG